MYFIIQQKYLAPALKCLELSRNVIRYGSLDDLEQALGYLDEAREQVKNAIEAAAEGRAELARGE